MSLSPFAILAQFAQFASEHGRDITALVKSFIRHEALIEVGSSDAPPEADDVAIDLEIDALIAAGKRRRPRKSRPTGGE